MTKREFCEGISVYLGILQDDAFAMGEALHAKALEIAATSENPNEAPEEAIFSASWYGKAEAYGIIKECFDSEIRNYTNDGEVLN